MRRGHLASVEMTGFNGNLGEFSPYHELPEIDRAPFGRHLGAMYTEQSVEEGKGEAILGQGGLPPTAGMQGDGRELARQLARAVRGAGVEVLMGHRAQDIERDGEGAVVGVSALGPDGLVRIAARRGVVFATGGFSQSKELSDRHLRGPIFGSGAVPTNVGDFIGIATRLGAKLENVENAWWAQVPLEAALQSRDLDWVLFHPFGDSMILVNGEGRRVVNEKATYDDRGPGHFGGGGRDAGFPNRILMMVYDEAVAQNTLDWAPRWPLPLPQGELSVRATGIDERALVITGQTLQKLTAK